MNWLTYFKRFTLTLILAFIGVISWGQTNLNKSIIKINDNAPYLCKGSTVTLQSTDIVVLDYNTGEPITSGFGISIVDSEANPITIGSNIGIGQYTLTISASDATCTGDQSKNFYVLPGTETYYTISDEDDWNRFADCVNDGYSFEGKTVKLTPSSSDVLSVTTMVGYTYPFSGTFDGNNKTLNVSYSGENYYMAPFYYTEGATIKNLTVTGNIVVVKDDYGYGYSAGLIYYNTSGEYVTRNTFVQNVIVSVNITGIDDDDNEISAGDYCAGFAVYSAYLDFSNCVYNGRIVAGNNCGGFSASYYEAGNATFSNCIFNPATGSSITGGSTFAENSESWSGCYYTYSTNLTEQGTRLYKNYTDAPDDIIVGPWEILGENVYGPVTVTTTAEETYLYDGTTNYYDDIIDCKVYFDNYEANSSDYDISITKGNGDPVNGEVINAGEYRLIITTKDKVERVYYGSETKTFYVVSELTGEGTSENPFKIRSSADWLVFENHVNNGDTYTDAQEQVHYYSEAYYKLTNDITVSTMVGTPEHPFKGNFSGTKGLYEAYTLTFNYGTSANPTRETIVAPFRYTEDAAFSSLIIDGAIYTNVGKEAGLIGVNTHASENNTTVQFVINNMDFYCFEDLLDAEGGGYAYDGSDISFLYCSYEGKISANNYHGGFCGKADEHTTFTRCLFDPEPEGFYWAENFVYDEQGAIINYNGTDETNGCFYTVGPNQEESDQGTMVFVNTVPEGNIGHRLTTFHEKVVYKPVTVVISGVNKRYTHTGNDITIDPDVTFNGIDAIDNNYCDWTITPSYPMHDVGQYTFTLTAPTTGATGEAAKYLGTINQIIRVVSSSSAGWTGLQAKLSGTQATIELTEDVVAGETDACLIIESGRTVTINLNGYKIDRNFNESEGVWRTPVVGGQVLKIASGATVTIYGNLIN